MIYPQYLSILQYYLYYTSTIQKKQESAPIFFRLIRKNENGDRVDMTTTANQYMISKAEGLSPPSGTISTFSYAGMDEGGQAVTVYQD